jgi:hypothetical protein
VIGYRWFMGTNRVSLPFISPQEEPVQATISYVDNLKPTATIAENPEAIPEPPSQEPEAYIFTPFGIVQIDHETAFSWIYFTAWAFSSDLTPAEGVAFSTSLSYPDGTTESQTVTTDEEGVAKFVYKIFTYGDYSFEVTDLKLSGYDYEFDANFYREFPVNVSSSEIEFAIPTGVNDFYSQFNQAFAEGDEEFLFDALHPAVIEQYGEDKCWSYLGTAINVPIEVSVNQLNDFGTWDWMVGDTAVSIPGAYTIDAEIALPDGAISSQETHLALNPENDMALSWFTYCEALDDQSSE